MTFFWDDFRMDDLVLGNERVPFEAIVLLESPQSRVRNDYGLKSNNHPMIR